MKVVAQKKRKRQVQPLGCFALISRILRRDLHGPSAGTITAFSEARRLDCSAFICRNHHQDTQTSPTKSAGFNSEPTSSFITRGRQRDTRGRWARVFSNPISLSGFIAVVRYAPPALTNSPTISRNRRCISDAVLIGKSRSRASDSNSVAHSGGIVAFGGNW